MCVRVSTIRMEFRVVCVRNFNFFPIIIYILRIPSIDSFNSSLRSRSKITFFIWFPLPFLFLRPQSPSEPKRLRERNFVFVSRSHLVILRDCMKIENVNHWKRMNWIQNAFHFDNTGANQKSAIKWSSISIVSLFNFSSSFTLRYIILFFRSLLLGRWIDIAKKHKQGNRISFDVDSHPSNRMNRKYADVYRKRFHSSFWGEQLERTAKAFHNFHVTTATGWNYTQTHAHKEPMYAKIFKD